MISTSPPLQQQPQLVQSGGASFDLQSLVPKPKKALNAYNIFYKLEHQRILANGIDSFIAAGQQLDTIEDMIRVRHEHQVKPKRAHRKTTGGKIGFQELNRLIAQRWKKVPAYAKQVYQQQAHLDKMAVEKQLIAWKRQQEEGNDNCLMNLMVAPPPKQAQVASFSTQESMMQSPPPPVPLDQSPRPRVVSMTMGTEDAFSLSQQVVGQQQEQEASITNGEDSSIEQLRERIDNRLAKLMGAAGASSTSGSSAVRVCSRSSSPLPPMKVLSKPTSMFSKPNRYARVTSLGVYDLSDFDLLGPGAMTNIFD
mmetsp:Transcript_8374/g.17421  ORF Transcript_8374/g.17421 Transcript_8374/m.17421 type:complete len:310 (-) Transcript_8374:65-994(-)|eukprot:CAMPEP_0172475890 /NCGR_PEP_ID=MMETSP1065-20121228/70102_1 /TAXON_ID=265537 /ORGANISM="Amphiprora paludosa, Strain CCMP125" /LENGTH=309 /DNA_ID=CAMNT_0013234105 /DNA_START=637 /DNA_END=1566 /DNA_ORIENTATION=-